MQTITKTFNVYNFDELNEEIKEKIIKQEEENIRIADIDNFLLEEMESKAISLLEEYFGENAIFNHVYYDLGYCQGDGAMIEFDLKYYNKNIEIRHNNFLYYHERSFIIDDTCNDLTHKQYEQLKNKIIRMNVELKEYGYKFIEEDRTDQAIEQLKDCMFYENGEIY
jgi:hypothetical protein